MEKNNKEVNADVQDLISTSKKVAREEKMQISEEQEDVEFEGEQQSGDLWDDDKAYELEREARMQQASEDDFDKMRQRRAEKERKAAETEDETEEDVYDDEEDFDEEEYDEDEEDVDPVEANLRKQVLKVKYNAPEDLENFEFSKPIVIPRRGARVEVRNMKQMWDFASKGVDYGMRMQQLAKYRDIITVADKFGITADELQAEYAEAKTDPIAFAEKFIKKHQIDVNDLDVFDHEVKDLDTIKAAAAANVPDNSIRLSDVNAQFVQNYYIVNGKEKTASLVECFDALPTETQRLFSNDPNLFRGWADDVESGVFQEAMGRIYEKTTNDERLAAMLETPNGFLQLYGMVGQEMFGTEQNQGRKPVGNSAERRPTRQVDRKVAQRQAAKEHLESLTSKPNSARKEVLADLWDDDEAYEKEYNKRMNGG